MRSGEHPLSTTSYAILGLLAARSWTTYELAKQVQRSLNWFWPRAERRLYDEPKRLVEAGYATATRQRTGQRPRTVYAITGRGREALQRWLGTPSAPRSVEFEGMLKVFFADSGSMDQLVRILADIEAEAEERIGRLAKMSAEGAAGTTGFPQRLHISALTLPLELEQETALLRWVRWARSQLDDWHGADDPGDWDPQAALSRISAACHAELSADSRKSAR